MFALGGVFAVVGGRLCDLFGLKPILLVGLAGSIWVSSALQASMPEVSTVNPLVLGGVVVVVTLATLLASLVPSLRAMRVDPLITFRTE